MAFNNIYLIIIIIIISRVKEWKGAMKYVAKDSPALVNSILVERQYSNC